MELKTLGTGSKGNAYLLKGQETNLLIEIGLPYKQIAKKIDYAFKDISGVLITHEHSDHSRGIKGIIQETELDVLGTRGTLLNLGVTVPMHRRKIMNYNKTYELKEWLITAFKVNHDAVQPSGFFIRNKKDKIVFITDTNKLDYFFKDLTHIIIEANYSNELLEKSSYDESLKRRIRKSHLEINQTIDFIKTCQKNSDRIASVTIIHYSSSNADYNEFRDRIELETGIRTFVSGIDC